MCCGVSLCCEKWRTAAEVEGGRSGNEGLDQRGKGASEREEADRKI